MIRSKNILGMSIAGTGLMLSLFAGSAAACPEHDKNAKGDPPACSECEGTNKEVAILSEIPMLGSLFKDSKSGGIELHGKSFGDLQFGNVVATGPEDKKHRVKLMNKAKGGQPEGDIRIEIRIIGDNGEVKEFSFDGGDFGEDFDFDFDFDFEGLHELKELKGLHAIKEIKGLHELKELKGLHKIKELNLDKLHEHLQQIKEQHSGHKGKVNQPEHGQFTFKLEGIEELEGLGEKLHKHLAEIEELHVVKELNLEKLHEHLQEIEIESLHEIENLHKHMQQLKERHGNQQSKAHNAFVVELDELEELKGMSEKLHKQMQNLKINGLHELKELEGLGERIEFEVMKDLKAHGGNVFVVEGEDVVKFGDKKHNVIVKRGPEDGKHASGVWTSGDEKIHVIKKGDSKGKGIGSWTTGSGGEWKSDDGKVHVIIKHGGEHGEGHGEGHSEDQGKGHDEDGQVHKIIKRSIGSASGGNHEIHVEGGAAGNIVIVGPDGVKKQFNVGGGANHEGEGHGEGGKVIKRYKVIKQGESGNWSTSKGGNVKIEGKAIYIGPDGKPHEVKFDEDGNHELHGNVQSFGTGGSFTFDDKDENVFFGGSPKNMSTGGFVVDNENVFFSPEHNVTFTPKGENAFFSAGGGDDAAYVSVIDDDTIAIEIKDGKVSAKINGKKVPADRIKKTKKGIEIIGEDGEVVCTVPVMGDVGSFGVSSGRGGNVMFGGGAGGAPQVMRFGAEDQPEPPKVMLGIQMQPVDAESVVALELDEGAGIQIIGVIKGLPAQLAGLQENDIVIDIRGVVGNVTQEALRGVLLSKNPGDVMELVVIREGELEEVEIELSPYNAEKLGMVVETPSRIQLGGGVRGFKFDDETQDELVKKYFDRLGDMNFDEHEMHIATEAFEEAMAQMKEQWGEDGPQGIWSSSGNGQWKVIHGDEPEHVFTIPAEPRAFSGGGKVVSKDIAELKAQLAVVQAQRDLLVAELSEIKELLKKLAGDRD